MARSIENPDVPVSYSGAFREYGLDYQDGGTSSLQIGYCPWCGDLLGSSLRDRWIEEVERLGMDLGDPELPPRYASERWWRGA